MNPSNHGHRAAVKALGGITVILGVAAAADLAARTFGTVAGAAVILAVFAACWLVHRARPLLHPAPLARNSGTREPEVTPETVTLAGTVASR